MQNSGVSATGLFWQGWASFKTNWGTTLLYMLVMLGVALGGFLAGLLGQALMMNENVLVMLAGVVWYVGAQLAAQTYSAGVGTRMALLGARGHVALREVLRVDRSSFWRMLGTMLLVILGVFVIGFALLLLPMLGLLLAGGPDNLLRGGMVLPIWLLIVFVAFMYVVLGFSLAYFRAIEGDRPTVAVKTSWVLMKGKRWTVIGFNVLCALAGLVAMLPLLFTILTGAILIADPGARAVVNALQILFGIVSIVIIPLGLFAVSGISLFGLGHFYLQAKK